MALTPVPVQTGGSRQNSRGLRIGPIRRSGDLAVAVLGTIAKSRRIALIANTLDKAEPIAKLLQGKKDLDCPVTALIDHPHFEVYLTEEVDEAVQKLLAGSLAD